METIKIETMKLTLVGESPLIVHAWSEKAKKAMRDKQQKKAKGAKEARNPLRDFVDSLYWLSEKPEEDASEKQIEKAIASGRFGFPVVAFKASAVDACSQVDGMTKVLARSTFHIDGDMVEIEGKPTMREDMVRVGMGAADLRYRGEFKQWQVHMTVKYNSLAISEEQIRNLFSIAGFGVGVGEWRPSKDGQFGRFRVE